MKWTDNLPDAVYNRLCACRSLKSDILILTQARWKYLKTKEKYCKEDALIYIFELLDSNSQYIDLTKDEYDDILQSIQ
jgi:hypothetical protein